MYDDGGRNVRGVDSRGVEQGEIVAWETTIIVRVVSKSGRSA